MRESLLVLGQAGSLLSFQSGALVSSIVAWHGKSTNISLELVSYDSRGIVMAFEMVVNFAGISSACR